MDKFMAVAVAICAAFMIFIIVIGILYLTGLS